MPDRNSPHRSTPADIGQSFRFPIEVTFAVFGFNQEAFIAEAVRGAFSQSYEPLEILLVDDASTDDTPRIMAEMASAYRGPAAVRVVVNETNLGYAGSVSKVMDLARGDLVVLAGGDDISYPHRTTAMVDAWQHVGRPAVCLHSLAQAMDGNGKDMAQIRGPWNADVLADPCALLRRGGSMLGATVACPRALFERFGSFSVPGIGNTEDVVLTFRSALLGGALFLSEPLLKYRVGTGISTQDSRSAARGARMALALRRVAQSAACTEQMARDLDAWIGEAGLLRRLLRNRRLVIECIALSYSSRLRAISAGARAFLDGVAHDGVVLRTVLARAVWRALSGGG